MGGLDKSHLVIDGRTILDRQLRVLHDVVDHVVIVSSDTARFAEAGVPVVSDVIPGAGALGGIYTALTLTQTPVLVLACDMPYLTASFLRHVIASARDADIAVPRTADGYHPLCACYRPSCADPIRKRLDAGTLKVIDLFGDLHVRTIDPAEIAPFDPDGLLLLNINTPDDAIRAERGRDRAHSPQSS